MRLRLIYANELKQRFDRYPPYIRDIVKKELRCVKTIDAEPVIRCKECKYNKGEINKKGFLICSANGMDITDDDYCSWGEREDENDSN